MKKTIFLAIIFSILQGQVFAENPANGFEAGGTGSTVATGLDQAFSDPGNLSDAEQTEANEFIHTGKQQRSLQENCKNKGLGTCDQNKVGEQGQIINDALEANLGKLYAAIFGGLGMLGGGGASVKATDKNGNTEERADVCMIGAIGYETVSGSIQTLMQQKATSAAQNVKDKQLQSLILLKEAHLARRDTSTMQAAAYGAIAGCYGVTMIASAAGSGVQVDGMMVAKMGAAAAISGIYIAKHVKHAEAAKKVQEVIDSLPKAGDCNPWTGTSCFCSEPTSKTLYADKYQQVCVLNNGNFETPIVNVGCGVMKDGKVEADPDCKCKQTKNCFQPHLSGGGISVGLGQNLMNDANKIFNELGDGNFDRGKLNTLTSQMAATNANARKKITPSSSKPIALTASQKKDADALSKYMPNDIAAKIAAMAPINPPGANDSALKSALASVPESLKKKVSSSDIDGGYTSNGSNSNNFDSKEEPFTIPSPSQNQKNDSIEVATYAEKALNNNADISLNKDTPLFDIISNRYRHSAGKRLSLEEEPKK